MSKCQAWWASLSKFAVPTATADAPAIYISGPQVVYYVKSLGHSVFLDLKLHDIPNTVESSMRVLARLGVDMVNVHAAGGVEMMVAAKRGLEAGTPTGR